MLDSLTKSTPLQRLQLYVDFLKNKKTYSDEEIKVLEEAFNED